MPMFHSYPLIGHRVPEQPLALFRGQVRSAAQFLGDVMALAARLPDAEAFFNACQNRYLFAVGFAACALRQRVCLLPASHSQQSIAQLQAAYPDVQCLSDQAGHDVGLPIRLVSEQDLAEAGAVHWPPPQLPAQQWVVRLFTSGSTGQPQGHDKHWGELVQATCAGMDALGLDALPGFAVLGTVPAQHTYGLESTILRPLLGGGLVCDETPFYPADIQAALACLPTPRVLVSTPFHLRTLLESGLALPSLQLITSATAPLPRELAQRLEARFAAPLREIYGSTETGQLAVRRSAQDETWACLAGIELQAVGEERVRAAGGHLWEPQMLNDRVEWIDARHFRLLGRTADLVNVAGKRSSLTYLTQQLLAIPGVEDGVFFLPEEAETDVVGRVAALVVAPQLEREALLAALRQRIDPVFLPRPLKFVDALPRNAISKIPLAQLRAALQGEGA